MDINLPGMNGTEALRNLRANEATSSIPVIAVSANAMPGDIKEGLKAGFDGYLTKPIRIAEVLNVIKQAIARPHTDV
jgi:CheY-like chemotaxis protein